MVDRTAGTRNPALEIEKAVGEVCTLVNKTYARSVATIISPVLSPFHPLRPPPHATRLWFLPRDIRSADNVLNTSKIRDLSTRTAEELVRELVTRPASTRLATPPASLRSADTVDPDMPGNLSFIPVFSSPTTHQPHRDAVFQGHALPCAECRKQPQAIGDLCLGCNSSIGRSNEPRLRELHLQDPKADSRTFPNPIHPTLASD